MVIVCIVSPCINSIPIGSMYAIYDDIYHQYTPNVSIYTIHGSYGIWHNFYSRLYSQEGCQAIGHSMDPPEEWCQKKPLRSRLTLFSPFEQWLLNPCWLMITTGWGPPVISCFINHEIIPMNTSSLYHVISTINHGSFSHLCAPTVHATTNGGPTLYQWDFQDPKLEVPTIYKAYF